MSDSLADSLLTEAEILALTRECKVYCGVYFLIKEKKIVYVGQSNNIYNRLARHIHGKKKDFDEFSFIEVPADRLHEVETAYILHFKPKYNQTHTGFLRTPMYGGERLLNRGKSEHVGLQRRYEEFTKEVEKDPIGWVKSIAAKLG